MFKRLLNKMQSQRIMDRALSLKRARYGKFTIIKSLVKAEIAHDDYGKLFYGVYGKGAFLHVRHFSGSNWVGEFFNATKGK